MKKTTTTIEKSRPESCALKISFGPDLIFLSLWFLFLNTSNYFSFVFLYENITTKNDEILFFSLNVFICFFLVQLFSFFFLFLYIFTVAYFFFFYLYVSLRSHTCFELMYIFPSAYKNIQKKLSIFDTYYIIRDRTHANQYCVLLLVCFVFFLSFFFFTCRTLELKKLYTPRVYLWLISRKKKHNPQFSRTKGIKMIEKIII